MNFQSLVRAWWSSKLVILPFPFDLCPWKVLQNVKLIQKGEDYRAMYSCVLFCTLFTTVHQLNINSFDMIHRNLVHVTKKHQEGTKSLKLLTYTHSGPLKFKSGNLDCSVFFSIVLSCHAFMCEW